MSKDKQIEEMAKYICRSRFAEGAILCEACDKECLYYQIATALTDKGYRKQSEGEWVKYPHGSGIYCSLCKHKRRYRDIKDNFCPNCGAKMKGGAER